MYTVHTMITYVPIISVHVMWCFVLCKFGLVNTIVKLNITCVTALKEGRDFAGIRRSVHQTVKTSTYALISVLSYLIIHGIQEHRNKQTSEGNQFTHRKVLYERNVQPLRYD